MRIGIVLMILALGAAEGMAKDIVHDAEHYLLAAQHGEKWASEDESIDALRAQFTQRIGDAEMNGTLALRGDAYRIDTGDQILVTDGTTSWVYSKPDNQLLVNDAVADETTFSPADFFTHYPDRFDVTVEGQESLGGVRHDRLRLVPKTDNAFLREVTLYVRSTDALPTRAVLADGNGTTVTFDLRDVEVNPRLSSDTFRFEAPEGAEVVDLRS